MSSVDPSASEDLEKRLLYTSRCGLCALYHFPEHQAFVARYEGNPSAEAVMQLRNEGLRLAEMYAPVIAWISDNRLLSVREVEDVEHALEDTIPRGKMIGFKYLIEMLPQSIMSELNMEEWREAAEALGIVCLQAWSYEEAFDAIQEHEQAADN